MTLRQLLLNMSFLPERVEQLVPLEAVLGEGSSLLDDEIKIELEDQVYLVVKEIYFLPGKTTVIRVTGKSLVCGKEYHNLCPAARTWCNCTCHKDDVEGLTPR